MPTASGETEWVGMRAWRVRSISFGWPLGSVCAFAVFAIVLLSWLLVTRLALNFHASGGVRTSAAAIVAYRASLLWCAPRCLWQ
jgi:hypothetical protein